MDLSMYIDYKNLRTFCAFSNKNFKIWTTFAIVFMTLTSYLFYKQESMENDNFSPAVGITDIIKKEVKYYIINTPGCHIENVATKTAGTSKFFKTKLTDPKCDKLWAPLNGKIKQKGPALIVSNITHLKLVRSSLKHYNINNIKQLACCYRPFSRVQQNQANYTKLADQLSSFSKACIVMDMHKESTMVSDGVEFVRIECSKKGTKKGGLNTSKQVYRDFHAFVPLKTSVEKRCTKKANQNLEKWSVLIIGIDSTSRLNMLRQLPRTHQVLTKSLSSEILLGYNKVGDNTLPNLVPLLTGLSEKQLRDICWQTRWKMFDSCPFIWKNYSINGYRTVYGEDSTEMSTFNYFKTGFVQQPTDYYLRTYLSESLKQQGHKKVSNLELCTGPRQTVSMILNYIQKFTLRFAESRYFGLFWINSVSHNDLNMPHIADKLIAETLTAIKNKNLLGRTVLIFLSDHGMRTGPFRETHQGKLEERLPMAYIHLPETFKKRYDKAAQQLHMNAHNRLTTPFDIHETIVDLLDPLLRIDNKTNMGKTEGGVSLFSSISENRTCKDAGISEHWCTCQASRSISTNSTIVSDAVNYVIKFLNTRLETQKAKCAQLKLFLIRNAAEQGPEVCLQSVCERFYTLSFVTLPGAAIFEATVSEKLDKYKKRNFTVLGPISRLNTYSTQSFCIDELSLKMYCYCI